MFTMYGQPAHWFIAMMLLLLVMETNATAQEKGDPTQEDTITRPNQDADEIAPEKMTVPRRHPLAPRPGIGRGERNKWVVIGPDGKKRELDTSNSAGVILKQSVETVTENGEQKVRVQGKAVVIGPDGKQTEYDLAEPVEPALGKLDWGMPEDLPARLQKMLEDFPVGPDRHNLFGPAEQILPGRLRQRQPSVEKYTVGLQCRPVLDSTLRYQLNLDEQIGLIVVRVLEDSPAADAGIQPHDILLYADQASLTSIPDLHEAVNRAGQEGLPLSLNLLSQGQEKGVEVQPVEKSGQGDDHPARWGQPRGLPAAEVIPGFEAHRQQMQEQMQRMRQEMLQLERQVIGGDTQIDKDQP